MHNDRDIPWRLEDGDFFTFAPKVSIISSSFASISSALFTSSGVPMTAAVSRHFATALMTTWSFAFVGLSSSVESLFR